MGGGPTFDQWRFARANQAAAAAQNMPGLDQASADRMLSLGSDRHAYEQAMMNYDVANPSGSTMVGRDTMAGMQTANEAREALLERQQQAREDEAARRQTRAREQELARRYVAARQPKKKKKTYTSYGAYEEEVPEQSGR